MDIHNIFSTPILLDFDNSDFEKEWDLMLQRERAILNFERALLEGTLSLGDLECFADNLAEHNIERYQYLHQITENIHFVIVNQILLETNGLV